MRTESNRPTVGNLVATAYYSSLAAWLRYDMIEEFNDVE